MKSNDFFHIIPLFIRNTGFRGTKYDIILDSMPKISFENPMYNNASTVGTEDYEIIEAMRSGEQCWVILLQQLIRHQR